MRMKFLGYGGLLVLLACSGALSAQQSLADVARAEEARRKTVKTPSKTYTNDDLKGGGSQSGAPAPAPAPTPASGQAGDKPDTKKPEPADEGPKKDEKYWKDRMTALRQQLDRNKVLLDALQSRVNALNTDFVNMDDPGQRSVIETNRRTALGEMDRMTRENEKVTKAIADLSEEARKASVPPGWLR